MVEERPTTQADIDLLAIEGRDDGFNLAPIETARLLRQGCDTSMNARSYFAGGELIAIRGEYRESLLSAEVHVWMVTSLAVKRHQIAFLRHAQRLVRQMAHLRVSCFCDPSFEATCRWLARLGFVPTGETEIAGRRFLVLEKVG